MLYLVVLTQFRTENRFTLFLELLRVLTQFRTENRFTLFLELLKARALAANAAFSPRHRI
ncbi:hypothetical protein CK226_16925 [Mesorhizobium sp. WSM4311]|nr:hypothetical protein CK226_16925 [Mesorhizobium sp. WSM4311]TRD08303.1 hypothetical protein FJV82_03860 [Mesorhizobium sp. WSM4305]